VLYAGSYVFATFQPSLLEITVACFALALVMLAVINYWNRSMYENVACRMWTTRAMAGFAVALVGGVTMQVLFNTGGASAGAGPAAVSPYIGNSPQCLAAISQGHWIETRCDDSAPAKTNSPVAYCQTSKWVWDASGKCPISKLPTSKLRAIYAGKKVLFAGDSEVRYIYHQFITILDPAYKQNGSSIAKHSNLHYQADFDRGLSVDFVWAPMVANVTSTMRTNFKTGGGYSLIATGATLWDTLYVRSLGDYSRDLGALAAELASTASARNGTKLVWMQSTTVATDRLTTDDKRNYMHEEAVQAHRAAFLASPAAKQFDTVIDGTRATANKLFKPVDGIHYTDDVYEVIAHMVSNGYTAHFPGIVSATAAKKPYKPKPTGSMSFPGLGAFALGLAVIMLFTMDSFLGIGYVSLLLFGRSYDWEAAYAGLHRKILGTDDRVRPSRESAGHEAAGDAENDSLLESKTNL
jgi:hypothetical protein